MDVYKIGIFGIPFIVVVFIALTFYLDYLDKKKKDIKKENNKSTEDVKNNAE